MLKSLVLTTLLTTGVATTTPVYNAPNLQEKAETTNVEEYELNINQSTVYQTIHNNVLTGNTETNYTTGTDYERSRQLSGYNDAVNVIGTTYITENIANDKLMVMNYDYLTSNTGGLNHYCTRALTVLQIDSYNFNRDTEISLKIHLEIADFSYNNTTVDYQAYQREILKTNQSDFSEFINRQHTDFNAARIFEQILDGNNGYLYQRTAYTFPKTSDNQLEELDIPLQPNATQYVVIQYTPVVKLDPTNTEKTIPVVNRTRFELNDWKISGTNYIPTSAYEVVDIPGLMWQILAMPFAFISQAFNFTLFPGTPYQVNIANLFLSIIAVFVFVWLIGLFMKLKQ